MIDEAILERRLAALEQAVAKLQRETGIAASAKDWPASLIPTVSDEEALLEAMQYARQFRNADKPADEPSTSK